ncbi:hypothetical protein FL583_39420, partial [Cryptosporangium phraense]
MSTRLLLEGPDLEELLAQIKEEHGAAARIVSAERVRSGGLAGFFAKQRFEIAVDILDPEEARPDSPAVPPTAEGLAGLLAQAEEQERKLDQVDRGVGRGRASAGRGGEGAASGRGGEGEAAGRGGEGAAAGRGGEGAAAGRGGEGAAAGRGGEGAAAGRGGEGAAAGRWGEGAAERPSGSAARFAQVLAGREAPVLNGVGDVVGEREQAVVRLAERSRRRPAPPAASDRPASPAPTEGGPDREPSARAPRGDRNAPGPDARTPGG